MRSQQPVIQGGRMSARELTPFQIAHRRMKANPEYQYKHRPAARRAEWLRVNGPCQICRSKKDLEVDHIDPSTKVSHRIWGWRGERRNLELAKCQVLCKRCHKKKTKEQRHLLCRKCAAPIGGAT